MNSVGQENIHGTWDDHDFGHDDRGGDYEFKTQSQELFLDFFAVPKDSERRALEGVYYSTLVNDDKIKLIFLDNRYHRDLYSKPDGDFLGKQQWDWLEFQLNNLPDTVKTTLVITGLTVLQTNWFRTNIGENWYRFPQARERLLKVLQGN